MLNVIFSNRSLTYKIFKILLLLLLFFSVAYNSWADKAATMESMHPGLAGGFLKSALLEPMDDKILLKADGITISQSEINNAIADHDPEMRGQLEKNLIFVLEQETVRRILLNEAQKTGIEVAEKDDDQVIQALFDQKTKDVTVSEDETRAFYQENKQMVGEVPFEQVAGGIRHYMLQDKKQQAVNEYIDSLSNLVQMHINEKWVKEQSRLALDNPVDKARRSGKPTMVEFGATGCVPCDMMRPILDKLKKDYPEKLNVVFIHIGEEQILASRFGIQAIPVQAFFDAQGKEVFRHVGFLAENEVIKQLEKMGVEK
ncbi:MAG: thioredoxin family protein [Desulfobacterales bacterium]